MDPKPKGHAETQRERPETLKLVQADFVDAFLAWSDVIASPEIFRLWAAISCVAGALERRTWSETAMGHLFPNLYVMLSAGPGVGKDNAINLTTKLWREVPGISMGPHSVNHASLLDALSGADRKIIVGGKLVSEYHGLCLVVGEFIVLCPSHDLEFLGRLNQIYDCPPDFRELRKYHKGTEYVIAKPYLNILAGNTPSLMKAVFPEEAWSGGFTSRLLMVYASTGPLAEPFAPGPNEDVKAILVDHLKRLTKMWGRFWWDEDAARRYLEWHRGGQKPKPTHTKLEHYCTRRTTHIQKLAMISSASRGTDLHVTLPDVERALTWLMLAEATMPDVFRAMLGRSDMDVLNELHYFLMGEHARRKKAIPIGTIYAFIVARVPSEKARGLVEVAEISGRIKRVGEGLFVPVARGDQAGVE